jgi:membrane protease subunit HflC
MNRIPLVPIALGAVVLLILLFNTVFIVPQTHQALVLEFGAAKRAINAPNNSSSGPGLYIKAPVYQNVVMIDRRNLGLNLEQQTIIAADQEQLVVDAYARWRIVDPLRFYKSLGSEQAAETQLDTIMISSLRRVLGSVALDDIISRRRAALMTLIRDEMNARAQAWGIQVIDVRIRQADLPEAVAERVYERMRTERQQVAAELRAEGDEQSAKIKADANKQVTVLLATAKEESDKIRGEGEAKRAAIFSQAYGRDPEFAAFYRSLQAYEKSMPKGTQMIIPPDGDYFRYLKSKSGGGK